MDTLSAHFFTWTGCNGTCDVSDLPDPPGPRFRVAGRTKTVDFVRRCEKRDREGDLEATEYLSEDGVFMITVFND